MSSASEHNHRQITIDPKGLRDAARIIIAAVLLTLVGLWIFQRNRGFILLLVLAWLLAIAMDPAIRWLVARGWKRGTAAASVLFLLLLSAVGFFALFGSVLFSQASGLVTTLPDTVTSVVNWLNTAFGTQLVPSEIVDSLEITPERLSSISGSLAGGIFGVLSMIVGGLFQMLTLLLFTFYIAADAPKLQRLIGSWLKPEQQEMFSRTWDITVAKTGGFVVSKIAMAAAAALAHAVFFLVMDVPYWLPMALITGITSQFIPTVGTYIGILAPTIVAAATDPKLGLWVVLFALVYQQFENYVISPKISRMTMDIHPAVAFGSVLVFANLFGAFGALVSVPIAAALISLAQTYGRRYELIPELTD
jgi:predicted PurR-regulated permease PerM